MYAVVTIGGHQYTVRPAEKLEVDKFSGQQGEIVRLSPILVVDDKVVKTGKEAQEYHVTAKILTHGRGEKIDVKRFRAKSRYRRHRGFRSHTTLLQIEDISPVVKRTAPSSTTKRAPVTKRVALRTKAK